jgi:hypothetical protein
MAEAVAYLSDNNPDAHFRFRLGDRVVSTLDSSASGVIVSGQCRYTVGGGPYQDVYEIKRSDGHIFRAKSTEIVKME